MVEAKEEGGRGVRERRGVLGSEGCSEVWEKLTSIFCTLKRIGLFSKKGSAPRSVCGRAPYTSPPTPTLMAMVGPSIGAMIRKAHAYLEKVLELAMATPAAHPAGPGEGGAAPAGGPSLAHSVTTFNIC